MADKVVIEIEARFFDGVTGNTKSADEALKKLGEEALKAKKKVDDLGKKKKKVKLDADAKKLLKKLDETDKKIEKLTKNGKVVTLSAKDKAMRTLLRLERRALNFASKTFQATIAVRDSKALATINKVSGAASRFAGKSWQTAVSIKDMATAPLAKIKNLLFSMKSLAIAVTAGLATNALVSRPIGLADAYSGAQIGFSTLLGETQGQQMMDDLDAFAKATPFATSEVIANTQQMIAMGWDAKNIIADMKIIGDAAAATGKGTEGLQRIALALSQIKTQGRVSTEELNQLAEAGISAKRYLAEGLGYGSGDEGIAKLAKDLESGKIGAEEGIQAILKGMQEYRGMMDATANETVAGLKSQIQDAFEISVFRRWGQGLQDGAKKGLGSIVDLLNTAEEGLDSLGDMLYEVGSNISNWFADRFANAVERVNEITDTYEFQHASLGEKAGMLWRGVVSDPLSEWWDSNEAKFVEKAGRLGEKAGVFLSNAIKAALGITDIFDDTKLSESGGMGIAQSFAKGFVDGFDVSGIGVKVVDAIASVWGALPGWAKVLLAGYGTAKAASGFGRMAGGLGQLAGGFGAAKGFLGAAGTGTGLLGAGASTAIAMGAGNLAGGASLGAGLLSALGLGGIAGGAVGGYSLFSGIADAVSGALTDNAVEKRARMAEGSKKVGGTLSGAALGAAIGSIIPGLGTVAGGLVGAGLGGALGAWRGGKAAADIRAAKVESEGLKKALEDSNTSAESINQAFEKGVWENMKRNMGDIKLTTEEIARLSNQIVFGKKQHAFDSFKQAQSQAKAAIQSLNEYGEATDRWMWKASLGATFNEDEVGTMVEQFDGYIQSAKQLVESKHYEFTAAVDLLLDGEEATRITETGNVFYGQIQETLNDLGGELSSTVKIALQDGVITLDEQAEIARLQQQIADITAKVAQAQAESEMELIKLKFSGGSLDMESFNGLMAQMKQTINERMAANDDAFTVALSGLKLQLAEGAITKEEYDAQVAALTEGYTATIDSLKAEVMGVELGIIADSNYGALLGEDAKGKLQSALETALAQDVDPIEWSPDKVRKLLGAESLSEEAAGALAQMLSDIFNQLEGLDVNPEVAVEPALKAVKKIKADDLAAQLGIPKEQAVTVLERITGAKSIENVIEVLGEEFGLRESDAWSILWQITGNKQIMNLISVTPNDFGIPPTIKTTAQVMIEGNPIFTGPGLNVGGAPSRGPRKALGGIVGGANIPGFADGGMTDSFGAQLVTVGEEGPEMIIPLSSQRRNRALKLWAKAGHLMKIPGFARGGMSNERQDEGIRFSNNYSADATPTVSNATQVDMGGVTVQINIDAKEQQGIVESIREQGAEIAETVAGILADALQVQFENTPTLGGA